MIERNTAKQQIAAARGLLMLVRTRALRSHTAATDVDQINDALRRLEHTTEALAKQVYQPDGAHEPAGACHG